MAWSHLEVNRPHLVYIILGGFTSLFMLCSSVVKERLYIGEATVATICGIIFGPHAANLINPMDWGNPDQITLEFSRIVLVVQCFAVGVELPKSYMEKHWKSVTTLLVPVMAFGWLITSLFIWWMFGNRLNWLDSLVVAACVTATDPVLASSVVGKGKFAKRVPKHLRDLLSAESGCNDGMAFPFIYLGLYLIRYHLDAGEVTFHWMCYTILYECIFGCLYGVLIGWGARVAIRKAHENDLIDRESFLVFYFVLALFCAGSGSILGVDDLLVGFACGVGFSNDGWFQQQTEESHVSNVIDLLLNLTFFVYFGTIIPWEQFNSPDILGITPWRLVVLGLFVILFRRIPIMLALKPAISDLKTWREALFAGHFGPIGVGAIFVAILARAELETESTTPLAVLPEPGFEHLNIIEMIWPITTFLVICSIVVHGSSIAVFTLGKHINTLTLTFSYTTAVEDGPTWMERLPRIQSRSKSSMSLRRPGESEPSLDEKAVEDADGTTSPVNIPRHFLRRQKEEDNPSRSSSKAARRRRRWDTGIGPGGPISQSAITPASRLRASEKTVGTPDSADITDQSPSSDTERGSPESPQQEMYREGDDIIVENEDGDVLSVQKPRQEGEPISDTKARAKRDAKHEMMEQQLGESLQKVKTEREGAENQKPAEHFGWRQRLEGLRRPSVASPTSAVERPRHGPARAYTFGNTVIIEDEDGEVIKTYQLTTNKEAPHRPPNERRGTIAENIVGKGTMDMLHRVGTYFGAQDSSSNAQPDLEAGEARRKASQANQDDDFIRFTLGSGGPRLGRDDFIKELARLDTRTRAHALDNQEASDKLKREVSRRASQLNRRPSTAPADSRRQSNESLSHVRTTETIPYHAISDSLAHFSFDHGGRETAAERRRRNAPSPHRLAETRLSDSESDADDEALRSSGKAAVSAAVSQSTAPPRPTLQQSSSTRGQVSYFEDPETEVERRRRQAALGMTDEDSSSDEEGGPTEGKAAPSRPSPGIRFADENTPGNNSGGMRLRWGEDVGKKP